jgi:hypothetical protein
MVSAAALTPSRQVVAQGALRVTHSEEAAPTAAAQPALQPARSLLHQLLGRWRFAIWFAGNFDGPPDASGTRVVEALYDELRLQWTETHDDSTRSQGVIGFDPQTARFYSSAVYSDGTGVQLLTGTPSSVEPLITFLPLTPVTKGDRRLMEAFTLTVIDPDHFTWAPLDRGWRAVFTRER